MADPPWQPPDPGRPREPGFWPAPAETTPGPPPGGSYGPPHAQPYGAPYAPPYAPIPSPSASGGVRMPVWVLVLLALALLAAGGIAGGVTGGLIGRATASSSSGSSSGNADLVQTYGPGGDLESFALDGGSCADVAVDGGASISPSDAVPCTAPHRIEVYVAIDAPAGDASSIDPDELKTFADEACYLAFEPYVGRSYDESDLDYTALAPTAAGWDAGSHRTYCVLERLDGERLEGPAKGSRR